MRELIDVITESRGLGARRPGEEFVSTSNPAEKIYVNSVTFYPQDNTAYPDYASMVTALRQVVDGLGAHADMIGKFKQTDRAFGVAVFDHTDGRRLAWVKPFAQVNPDPAQNNWSNQQGIPGFKYNSKAAAKTQAGMTPQDVLTDQSDLTASDIVAQIAAKFGDTSPLTQAAQMVANGQMLPITVPATTDLSFTAFRDYFCEILQPMALHTGMYSGNAGEAASRFLSGGFNDTIITFDDSKTAGLSDSIMTTSDGRYVKVSTKGGKGATASAKNLIDSVKELEHTDEFSRSSQKINIYKLLSTSQTTKATNYISDYSYCPSSITSFL